MHPDGPQHLQLHNYYRLLCLACKQYSTRRSKRFEHTFLSDPAKQGRYRPVIQLLYLSYLLVSWILLSLFGASYLYVCAQQAHLAARLAQSSPTSALFVLLLHHNHAFPGHSGVLGYNE